MQNPIQKFRQNSFVPGILSEKLKLLSTKWCSEFFIFCLELELFTKIKKELVSKPSKKLKKEIPNTLLLTLVR